jgi:hypothetical protein
LLALLGIGLFAYWFDEVLVVIELAPEATFNGQFQGDFAEAGEPDSANDEACTGGGPILLKRFKQEATISERCIGVGSASSNKGTTLIISLFF